MLIFWKLFQISYRNVLRNKRRSLLTLLILVLGTTGLILVGGFFDNIMEEFREQVIHSHTGHLLVSKTGYYEKGASDPFYYLMKDVSKIQEVIASNSHVLFTVPRITFSAMASSDKASVAVLAYGVDPELENRMGGFKAPNQKISSTNIVAGRDLEPNDPGGIILGKSLMKAVDLNVGNNLSLITTRASGALDGGAYQIRGAFETIMKDFDDRGVKISLDSAQKILGTPDQVHALLVILDKTENTRLVKNQLEDLFKSAKMDLEVIPWDEQGQYYNQSKAMLNKIFGVVQIIISIIFFLSIMNIINMMIFERMREFGTMLAIGNSPVLVFGMIVIETLVLGLLGITFGIVIGCVVAKIISAIGISMPPPPQGTRGYTAAISLHANLLVHIWFYSTLTSLLASFFPAFRAARSKITEALGHV